MPVVIRVLVLAVILLPVMISCKTEQNAPNWSGEAPLTIGQYLENNQKEYSKFYRILVQGEMLTTLYAYNHYGDNYILFLPTDEAIDRFI